LTPILNIRTKRVLSAGVPLLLFLAVFLIDIVRKGVEIDIVWLRLLRDGFSIVAFYLSYLFFTSLKGTTSQDPMKAQRMLLLFGVTFVLAFPSWPMYRHGGFVAVNYNLVPKDYSTVFLSHIVSVISGLLIILVLLYMKDLVLFKRRKWTKRNYGGFLVATLAASASTYFGSPLQIPVATSLLLAVAIFLGFVNSVRLPWIVYLSRREKIRSLWRTLALMITFIGISYVSSSSAFFENTLLYYSPALRYFVSITATFCAMYFGVAFVSTLFHFPTAEAFERKRTELSSLHNLTRLVSRVLNFEELVDTVTKMTLEVCGAESAWLELVRPTKSSVNSGNENTAVNRHTFDVVSSKNITEDEIRGIAATNGSSVRDTIFQAKKVILINDVGVESLTRHLRSGSKKIGSLLVVPLISHSEVTGILYATKEIEYGFDQEDIDALSALADHVSISIENSRLIQESLERERLQREMLVAQSMQRRLLPQVLPECTNFDIDAVSSMAQLVGGDYYDFTFLDEERLALVIGDVSGKGVPAAFYMAEVKGIFQSLSKVCRSPRDFVVKANQSLYGSIDRRSFISLLYAILDIRTGRLSMSRAGHCPMLYVSGERVEYIRPTGLGLGLTDGPLFDKSIEEVRIDLRPGDVCVLYSDGVTETRGAHEEEFGYDRLREVVQRANGGSAREIKQSILDGIKEYAGVLDGEDDLTLIVLKWGA
jgi:sigma-B regulation protein RsbU (phosphoserine phosphatase)